MKLATLGGWAALTCAATYLIGFALLVTVLAPLGYGSQQIDPAAVVAFNATHPGLLTGWNTVIYIVNAVALVVLVVSVSRALSDAAPTAASLSRAFGLVWATLVLGAGMIANVALEKVGQMAGQDSDAAAQFWEVMHAVELGLGGGNEIAGGVWLLTVGLGGWMGTSLSRLVSGLAIVVGVAGLATIVPVIGDLAGVVFGLGAIAWFLLVGVFLLRRQRTTDHAHA